MQLLGPAGQGLAGHMDPFTRGMLFADAFRDMLFVLFVTMRIL